MSQEGYQGWANYPTWAVALWIDNNQGDYEQAISIAQDWVDDEPDLATMRVADELEGWIEEAQPDLGATLYGDLLGWAIEMVDWRELAEHYLEAAKEQ